MLVAELSASAGELAELINVTKKKLVGSTDTLDELTILAPVELGYERVVTL